jgi:hypothetical protein
MYFDESSRSPRKSMQALEEIISDFALLTSGRGFARKWSAIKWYFYTTDGIYFNWFIMLWSLVHAFVIQFLDWFSYVFALEVIWRWFKNLSSIQAMVFDRTQFLIINIILFHLHRSHLSTDVAWREKKFKHFVFY